MHDQTAVADARYAGLAKELPDQVTAPPKKPKDDACADDKPASSEARRRQSSARICVEHTNTELRQWAPLRRFTGRREIYAEIHLSIAGLVSDRSAQRPTRRRTSTERALVRNGAC
jgi:hypothetical protein